MKTKIMFDGKAKMEVPDPESFRTPAGDYAPSLTRVFYNPLMEFCRDISVSVARVLSKRLKFIKACDPLAGVGVRGVRYALEVGGVSGILINDLSPEAFELIKRNVEMNGVTHLAECRNSDANLVLCENRGRFNFVDIDPFGSPAPFIEAACSATTRRGMLAITATDTAPLSGTHPRACVRRYGAKPLRTEYCHELGIRILAGFSQRVGGKQEIALKPVLSHATQHYFRIYFELDRGANRTDEILGEQGYVSHCFRCGSRVLNRGLVTELPNACNCGGKFYHAGPLWLGSLIDQNFAQETMMDLVMRDFKLKYKELHLLNRCIEEAEGPATFYDLNCLAGHAGAPPPKIALLIAKLRATGRFASRTHFSNTGLRTNAPMDEILHIIRELD